MHVNRPLVVLGAAGAMLLAGCGGSSAPSTSSGQADAGADPGDSSFETADPTAGDSDAAGIDVCSLLSQEDAAATARAHGLNGAQTATTEYTLTATPQNAETGMNPGSSCKFSIEGEGAQGTVVVQVQSAQDFSLYSSGTEVAGLGDEAYRVQGSTVVRVGDLMLSVGESSVTDEFVVDLYRSMIPNLE